MSYHFGCLTTVHGSFVNKVQPCMMSHCVSLLTESSSPWFSASLAPSIAETRKCWGQRWLHDSRERTIQCIPFPWENYTMQWGTTLLQFNRMQSEVIKFRGTVSNQPPINCPIGDNTGRCTCAWRRLRASIGVSHTLTQSARSCFRIIIEVLVFSVVCMGWQALTLGLDTLSVYWCSPKYLLSYIAINCYFPGSPG